MCSRRRRRRGEDWTLFCEQQVQLSNKQLFSYIPEHLAPEYKFFLLFLFSSRALIRYSRVSICFKVIGHLFLGILSKPFSASNSRDAIAFRYRRSSSERSLLNLNWPTGWAMISLHVEGLLFTHWWIEDPRNFVIIRWPIKLLSARKIISCLGLFGAQFN